MHEHGGHDRPECDVILKGGISSGVVYPRALARLAAHDRLRSLGGASAGAIAAAAAAAAEYGRAQGGFERLAALPDALAASDARNATRLFRLFRPQPSTRRLYATLVAGLMPERPRWGLAALRWLLAAVRYFPLAALAALALALLSLWTLSMRSAGVADGLVLWCKAGAAVVVGAVIFLLTLAIALLVHALRRVPADGYGLCSAPAHPASAVMRHARLRA